MKNEYLYAKRLAFLEYIEVESANGCWWLHRDGAINRTG